MSNVGKVRFGNENDIAWVIQEKGDYLTLVRLHWHCGSLSMYPSINADRVKMISVSSFEEKYPYESDFGSVRDLVDDMVHTRFFREGHDKIKNGEGEYFRDSGSKWFQDVTGGIIRCIARIKGGYLAIKYNFFAGDMMGGGPTVSAAGYILWDVFMDNVHELVTASGMAWLGELRTRALDERTWFL